MLKVIVTKLGKRIQHGGMVLSTPCKFFINENEKTQIEVLMMRNGIEKSAYKFEEVKDKPAIQGANEAITKQHQELAKKVSEQAKATKVEEPEVKPEAKKEEPKAEGRKFGKR